MRNKENLDYIYKQNLEESDCPSLSNRKKWKLRKRKNEYSSKIVVDRDNFFIRFILYFLSYLNKAFLLSKSTILF